MRRAACGTWPSPISAEALARAGVTLSSVRVAGGAPYWVESRPSEGGRHVLATPAPDGPVRELTPATFDVRSRVHEYGGTPYLIAPEAILFTHFADQRLYAQRRGEPPTAVTPEGYRYADFELDPSGERVLCVREDHQGSTAGAEPSNAIVSLALGARPRAGRDGRSTASSGDPGVVLFGDSDFVAYPRVSRDGRQLAWISWNHPDMPWDGTTLHVARLTSAGLLQMTSIAGGPGESVVEPRWDTDGSLYFLSDRSNWWNLYRWRDGKVERAVTIDADIAEPLWTLGASSYALTGQGRAVVRYAIDGSDRLGVVTLASGELEPLALPFVAFSSLQMLSPATALAIASSAVAEAAVVAIELEGARHRIVRTASTLELDPAWISRAEAMEFPTTGGLTAHAFYYPPTSPECSPLPGEKPPLIVKAHGGPTAHAKPELSLPTQFWTSRGFAVLDVNYGGSSGYGRRYRERLEGHWGVVDVADVVAGARHLVAIGRVDPQRIAIRGGSAGGFTVLAALAFHDVFRAGANYYGVSDLEALARETHKFESRYLDRLVAPLPEGREIYAARAPIRHLERFHAPLITFQGVEDRIVPPSQSRAIVAALERKGVPAVYIEFAGEQHGFRKAESIVRSLEAELAFYGRVFGFAPQASEHTVP
ncbi:MAG TPA: prolyl oligopeptidase family serine peptidase [Steroidobacteraceae bacterium]|nr:prolyl oligopeptidase family serine peptidase [Steroidobacteraceae bacterium]